MATQPSTTATPKRPPKGASSQSLNHLLNFSLPPRQTHQVQSLPRRSRKTGNTHGVWNKERFVNAQYRFVMNPLGDYTVHFADPDIFFQWQDILQIIIPRDSALATAAAGGGDRPSHEEGHTTCPICLSPPSAPRMTKCGHVFCFPCILHYLTTSEHTKWARCPICFDSVNEKQLKSVHWSTPPPEPEPDDAESQPRASSSSVSADAHAAETPQPGTTLRMRLMQRPQITTLALPRSPTWPSDLLPPHQAPFHFLPDVHTHAKFMLATPAYLLDGLAHDLADIALERRALAAQDDALSIVFCDAAEERLHAQVAKATALDTEELRTAIERAQQMAQELTARAALHAQRRLERETAPTPEPLDTPPHLLSTQPSRGAKPRRNLNPPPPSTSTYYYYQAASGLPLFLHPLDIKVLTAHFGPYAAFPDTIAVRVEAAAEGAVDAELRRRCRYLAHLPAGADVVFVEADLARIVGPEGIRAFEGALKARRARRREKGRKDERARARAEERERERLAAPGGAWVRAPPSPAWDELELELEPEPAPAPQQQQQQQAPSGAWGARSFAAAAHASGGGGTGRTPARARPQLRDDGDEWELEAALGELEQRGAGGGRRRRAKMVVLGGGHGGRRR